MGCLLAWREGLLDRFPVCFRHEVRIVLILSQYPPAIWGEFGQFLYPIRCMINPKAYP
jgi:hypothetical protein